MNDGHAESRTPRGEQSSGVVKKGGITVAGAVLNGVLVLLAEIVVARTVGVEIYGLYALGVVITRIGSLLSIFGLGIGVLHYLPIYVSEGRREPLIGTVISSLVLPLVLGCLLSLVCWFAAPWLANQVFEKPDAIPYIRVLGLAMALMALAEVAGNITRAYGHAIYYVIVRNVVPPVSYLGLLLLVRLSDGEPIWVAVSFWSSQGLAVLAGGLILVKVVGPDLWRLKPDFRPLELYRYSLPILVNVILYMGIGWTNVLLIGTFMAADQVGIYRACLQVVIVFDIVLRGFAAATAPIFPLLLKRQDRQGLEHTYALAVRWITLLALPAFLVIFLNASDILGLLGPAFTAGATAVGILAFGHLLRACFSTAGVLLVVGRRQRSDTLAAAVAAAVNLTLALFLIPVAGIEGAAAATALGMVAFSAVREIRVQVTMGVRTLRWAMLRVVFWISAAALTAFGLAAWVGIGPGTGHLALALRLCLMGAAILPALWFFGFNPEDKALLRKASRAVGIGRGRSGADPSAP